ncbi:MAG: ERCC4 domain-containing protein [Candidatus Nanoarchaeia archaeon]|nr:helix-hairpin-helix domain-containing protein [Candidatus Jingweiarchaeum tengchongense]
MEVLVDIREKNSIIPEQLEKLKVPFSFQFLEVGDYIINDICIERKNVQDYVSSLIDGRLNNQLYQMSYNYSYSILVVEGFIDEVLMFRNVKRQQYISSIAGTMIKRAPEGKQGVISMITLTTPFDTALLIKYVYDKVLEGEPRLPKALIPQKNVRKEDRVLLVLQSLPGIGEMKAKLLLERFGTVENLVKADVYELSEVKGIGLETAKKIWEVLH